MGYYNNVAYRTTPFINEGFYHVFNRGVEKRQIFLNDRDYDRFLQTIYYYQYDKPKPKFSNQKRFKLNDFNKNNKIVEIICYCLMPNHFHLLLKQLKDGGIQEFANKISNSYTKYFNIKHGRVGHLFQGAFKATFIETDEELLHVSRYIHLNPYVADLTKNLETFPYSSYPDFLGISSGQICVAEPILNFFKNGAEYKQFINDHQDYAERLHKISHLTIDIDY